MSILQDYTFQIVLISCICIGASLSLLGCFVVLQKKSLLADAVAHSILPGICLAFWWQGNKNFFLLIVGAFLSASLSLLSISAIKKYTKLKDDTALSLVLAVFFGMGILFLTYIQKNGNAAQSGLDRFLLGKAASILQEDMWMIVGMSALIILSVLFFYRGFYLMTFDKNYAQTIGISTFFLEILFSSLLIVAIVVSIQMVGVVLVSAMFITPFVAARNWSNHLKTIICIAIVLGIVAAVVGTYISYIFTAFATGPCIVIAISLFAFISLAIKRKSLQNK